MNCPSCSHGVLKPIKLEQSMPAYQCHKCGGTLVDVLSYRIWAESFSQSALNKTAPLSEIVDSTDAINCPRCTRIMAKYRIAASVENRLDLCSYCGEIWFDGGEWQLLKQLELNDNLPRLFTDPWQKNIRKDTIDKSIEDKFEKLFGSEDYLKIKDFRDWLQSRGNMAEILDYLQRDRD